MKLLLTLIAVLTLGCVGAPDSEPQSPDSETIPDSTADVGVEDDATNIDDVSTFDNDTKVDPTCEPTVSACDTTMCGSVSNGCGMEIDCGTCECDGGEPQVTNCGPCNMGSIQCEEGATGEGTCVYPELLDSISCDEVYFYDPTSTTDGLGTIENPFGNELDQVLDLAENSNRKLVVIKQGDGELSEAIYVREGVSVIGGFSETFSYQPDVRTAFTIDSSRGLSIRNINEATLISNLELMLLPQSGDSTAVRIVESPKVQVHNVKAQAADAKDGAPGQDGNNGSNGLRGNDGRNGLLSQGGASSCSGWYGQYGGQSIAQACSGQTDRATKGGGSGGLLIEVPGQSYVCDRTGRDGDGVFGGIGGKYLGDGNFRVAGNGGPGLSYVGRAESGVDASDDVVLTESGSLIRNSGTNGESGRHGLSGYGGGGGYLNGNIRGGSGGSGGTGGCGGSSGRGGQGGGSSIGLIILNSIGAEIEHSEFYAGNAGDGGAGSFGGNGGNGAYGGDGGTASNNSLNQKGGKGGRGGNGEDGGHGGAGAGGHSFGTIDPDGAAANETNVFQAGSHGAGGIGQNGRAPNGKSSDVHTDVVINSGF